MRADTLGVAGNRYGATPRIDALAGQGAWSDRMYCVQPLCAPSRASMITGMTPRGHGVWSNGLTLSEDLPTVGAELAAAGYATALIGKAHFSIYWQHPDLPPERALETPQAWADGLVPEDWNGPYYGFDHVELTLRHNYVRGGHIRRQQEANGKFRDLADVQHAIEPPIWEGAWKSALPVEQHPTTWVAERTIAYLREHRQEPFFLWASIPDPHHPFAPSGHYADLYDPDEIDLPETFGSDLNGKPEHVRDYAAGRLQRDMEGSGAGSADLSTMSTAAWRQVTAFYYGMCRQIDDAVGNILDALDELGLADDTLVIFSADHGELLGDHSLLYKGPFAYEGLQRVPFVARMPGAPGGLSLPGLGSQIDLAPTFCDVAGIAVPPHMQGRPMTGWLNGGAGRSSALCEFQGRYFDFCSRTLVTQDWKLTRYAGGPCSELYDLANDPGERFNLYDSADHASVRTELTERLLEEVLLAEGRWPPPVVHA